MSIDFPKEEEQVLRRWKKIKAFETQIELSKGKQPYTFYDGPPFATGLPHYGHLLSSTIKDIIPRYWAMKGRYVERRFGWDTHGVPIEYEIDKRHGMSGKDLVAKLGIAQYNAECRAIVMKFATEWRQTVERLGRWIDFDNDYKTMDPTFMESVWWVFSELFKKGLVYKGYKVMPYSTALNTPLSNFESQQNYKDTQDPAVVVTFPLLKDPQTCLLAWTTTPWTLPSNIALAAHPDFDYVKILDEASGKYYILLEVLMRTLYKDPKKAKYKVVERLKGEDMLGWQYEPLFDYFYENFRDHGFKVLNATYVTADSGVGIVHQAPSFGEEDYKVALEAGVITPERLPPNPVDDQGNFTAEVREFVGQHVKDADKAIIKYLKGTGRLIVDSQITHSYPFCWRSDTPLIYKAVPAWFVKIPPVIPTMLENIEKSHWVPNFVKENRFGSWIANARDWNISRNRYWGTPMPIWASEDFQEIVCVGSVEELKALSGFKGDLSDIHRDKVDHITIPKRAEDPRSVHFLDFPEVREELFDEEVERRVARMQRVIELGRVSRERRTMGLKQPLKTLVVIHPEGEFLSDVRSLESEICEELNIHDLILSSDEDKYNVQYSVSADWPTLGKKLKKDAQKVRKALPSLKSEDVRQFVASGKITVDGINLAREDLLVKRGLKEDESSKNLETNTDDDVLTILDVEMHPDLQREGIAREVVNRVQQLRKRAKLVPTDDVKMEYKVLSDPDEIGIEEVFEGHGRTFEKALRRPLDKHVVTQVGGEASDAMTEVVLAEEQQEVQKATFLLRLVKL
ncbi:isoleucyl-tRNA synthetase, partial [Lecanoromycetidae sp. Uapishka_2]